RDVIAARPHIRGAPGGECQRLRPLAVLLAMALEEEAGRFPAELPGGGRRHGAAVERVKIAPGGEHVEASARGRTRRPRLDKAAIEPGEQAGELGSTARDEHGTQAVLDLLQDSTGARPIRLGRASAGNERSREPLE